MLLAGGNAVPVLREVFGGSPGKRLKRERRVVSAARSHYRSSQDSKVRRLVRKAPAVDNIRFRIIAHARAAVGVRCRAHGADGISDRGDGAGGFVPPLHFVLNEGGEFVFVLLIVGGDTADGKAERVLYCGVEVQIVVLYGSVVFCRYAVFQRSAFSLMNAFQAEPHAGALPKVFMLAAAIGLRSE